MTNGQKPPLIGIMTARNSNGRIVGNIPLFTSIQTKLHALNVSCFMFIPEEIEEDSIIGYTFSQERLRWEKKRFPYPDLVYNRIPFRKTEKDEKTQQFFSTLIEKNIPFFNPCFIDKYELYQLFNSHAILKRYLPQTLLVRNQKEFYSFFNKHNNIYLKPSQSSKGKGIIRLRMIDSSTIQLAGINLSRDYSSIAQFWEEWGKELVTKHYLAQEEINSAEFQGKRFDFRILAHANHDDYIPTGVGIRQSFEQDITTHILAGGRLLPYEKLQSIEHDRFIHTIVPLVGRILSERYGYFGEFSIDAGVSQTGLYYIYEVNSKPMSFDEIEIEERKLDHLCQLFLTLTNYKNIQNLI